MLHDATTIFLAEYFDETLQVFAEFGLFYFAFVQTA